jgi:CheY-like chemotaxis protein
MIPSLVQTARSGCASWSSMIWSMLLTAWRCSCAGWGYEVRVVYDGAIAVSAAAEFAPRAILLDLALPKVDGFQIASRLRQDFVLQSVCLIAISGYGQADDVARTRDAGFDFHLLKPVNFNELQRLLAALPR